jgi:cytochrome c553
MPLRLLRGLALFVVLPLGFLALAATIGVLLGSSRVLAPRALSPSPGTDWGGGSAARGRHVAASYGACLDCHGADLAGGKAFFRGPMGTLVAPNLTRGVGGVGSAYSDSDLERAIRAGVRPDGSGLLVMPSVAFANMSDADLRDVIAYLRSVPAVNRSTPARVIGPLARVLLATGQLRVEPDRIDAAMTHPATTPAGATIEHGRYLASVGACMECHGANLAGGHYRGSPKDPPASNITPAGIGAWTESDFNRTLRLGRDPRGHVLNQFMPWTSYAQLDDDELAALWTYLRSVPPVKS